MAGNYDDYGAFAGGPTAKDKFDEEVDEWKTARKRYRALHVAAGAAKDAGDTVSEMAKEKAAWGDVWGTVCEGRLAGFGPHIINSLEQGYLLPGAGVMEFRDEDCVNIIEEIRNSLLVHGEQNIAVIVGDVAINVWILLFFASLRASDAVTISFSKDLARAHTVDLVIDFEISLTALKSPLLAIGNPASI